MNEAWRSGAVGVMNDRLAELESALRAQAALIFEAQSLLTGYLSKEIESPALFDGLLRLLDGPQQRETLRLVAEALGEDFGNNA